MSNLNKDRTYSDQVDIECIKSVLIMINNDIKDIKKDERTTKEQKVHLVFSLSSQRSKLVATSTKLYPHIDWMTEAFGEEQEPRRDSKLKELFAGLGLN